MKTTHLIGELKEHRLILDRLQQALAVKEFSLLIIFPTLSLLKTIQAELVSQTLGGIGGVRFLLFEGFIQEIRQRFSLNQRVPSAITRELLIMEVFERLQVEGKLDYLGKVPFAAGYRQAILAGIAEWQRSCLTAAIFERWAIGQGAKEQQLACLYQSYQTELQKRGYTDEETTLAELDRLTTKKGSFEERLQIILYGFTDLTPLQRKYLDKLAIWFDFELMIDPTGVSEIQGFIARQFPGIMEPQEPVKLPNRALAKLQTYFWLKEPEPNMLEAEDDSLQLIRTAGWTRQAMGIAREIRYLLRKNPNYRIEDFLILSPQPQNFIKAAMPLFKEYRLPLMKETVSIKEYSSFKRFSQALVVGSEDWLWPEMEVYIRHHYFGKQTVEGDRFLLELGERYGALSGRKRWISLLKSSSFQQYFAEKGLNLNPLQTSISFMERIPERANLKDYLKMAHEWFIFAMELELNSSSNDGNEHAQQFEQCKAIQTLLKLIAEILNYIDNSAFLAREITIKEFQGFWLDFLTSVEVQINSSSESAIKVLVPQEGRGLRAKVVFITSLEQGVFPRNYINDWKLAPKARRELKNFGVELETGEEYLTQERLAFYWSLQIAEESLYLVFQEQDNNGQPISHSMFLDEVWQWFPDLRTRAKIYPLAPELPVSFTECYSGSEVKSRLASYLVSTPSTIPASECRTCKELIRDPYYQMMVAQIWQGYKYSNELTERFFIDQAATILLEKLFGDDHIFAITALEDYHSCPYRFFLKYVLKIRPLHKPQLLPDNLDLGNLYHQVLQGFCECYREQCLVNQRLQEYQSTLNKCFESFYCEWKENSANDLVNLVLLLQKEQIRTTLNRWLQSEVRWTEESVGRFKIGFLEFGFGLVRGDFDPASLPEAYQLIAKGQKVKIWGKIDRVDIDSEGNFVVYDYKLGRGPSTKDILQIDYFQILLYLQALEKLYFGVHKAVGGSYLGLKDPSRTRSGLWNSNRLRIPLSGKCLLTETEWQEWLEIVNNTIIDNVQGIRNGDFFINGKKCLPYCEYRSCCRPIERREGERFDEASVE